MMKSKVTEALLMPLVFFLVLLAGSESAADEIGVKKPNINPHDFSRADLCATCHKGEPPALLLDPVTTCVKCHPGNIGNHPVTKHPMGLMTRIKIPSYLPLTEDGEMVCYTCHNPHKATKHPKMLRVDYFRLCQACHVGY